MVVYEPKPGPSPLLKLIVGGGAVLIIGAIAVFAVRAMLFPPARTFSPDDPCYYVPGYLKNINLLMNQVDQELELLGDRPDPTWEEYPAGLAVFRGAVQKLDQLHPPAIAREFHDSLREMLLGIVRFFEELLTTAEFDLNKFGEFLDKMVQLGIAKDELANQCGIDLEDIAQRGSAT